MIRYPLTQLFSLLFYFILFFVISTSTFALPTIKSGILTIGIYYNNPPYEYIQNNKKVGFEIDLINAIAEELKLKPHYVQTTWENMLNQLDHHDFDLAAGGITITPDRLKQYRASNPYVTTIIAVLIDHTNTPFLTMLADLKGHTVGVQEKTTDYDIALQMKNNSQIANIKTYSFSDFLSKGILDLKEKKVDALFKTKLSWLFVVRNNKNFKILATIPNTPQPIGFLFNKDSDNLQQAFNSAQTKLIKDGTFNQIYNRWFGNEKVD